MESLVAEKQSALVRVEPKSGLLVARATPYELTLDEIYDAFVDDAPFQEERQLLFSALLVYMQQTQHIVPDRRVWVDGSFISLRQDRAPSDVDLLLIVNNPTARQKRQLGSRGLLTMSDVKGKIGNVEIPDLPKLSPYGGMVDAYYVDSSHTATVSTWSENWSTPKGEDGQLDFSRSKGFVEVIENE